MSGLFAFKENLPTINHRKAKCFLIEATAGAELFFISSVTCEQDRKVLELLMQFVST